MLLSHNTVVPWRKLGRLYGKLLRVATFSLAIAGTRASNMCVLTLNEFYRVAKGGPNRSLDVPSAVLMGAMLPWTLVVIMPTNDTLLSKKELSEAGAAQHKTQIISALELCIYYVCRRSSTSSLQYGFHAVFALMRSSIEMVCTYGYRAGSSSQGRGAVGHFLWPQQSFRKWSTRAAGGVL